MRISELPAAAGRSLRELDLRSRTGLLVVAIVHASGDRAFGPPADVTLRPDDEIIVVGPMGSVAKLVSLFGQAR